MSDVTETPLPGVGVRMDFTTRGNERIGLIAHRAGHRDLLIYDRDDPDECGRVVRLEEDDVRTLADLLGVSHVAEELTHHLQSIQGMAIDWVPVDGTSACAGRTLRDMGVNRTIGASVVAVIRGEQTIQSPPEEFVLIDGDTAVVVGTDEGVRQLFDLLQAR
jgi:TrkA domain protein